MNAGDLLFGVELTVMIDGSVAAHTNSADLTVSRDVQDITNMGATDIWTRNVPLKKASWSGNIEGLVVRDDYTGGGKTFNELLNEMVDNHTPVEVAIKPDASGLTYRYGQALITELSLSGDNSGEAATYSASYTGAGPLDSSTVQ